MDVFWVVAPCSLVGVYRPFRGAFCFHDQDYTSIIALMMEAVSISEMSVNFYETARRNNPEDSRLHVWRFVSFGNAFLMFFFLQCIIINVEHSSCVPDIRSAVQEIFGLSYNPKVYSCIYKICHWTLFVAR
jgi:hypothetical protein